MTSRSLTTCLVKRVRNQKQGARVSEEKQNPKQPQRLRQTKHVGAHSCNEKKKSNSKFCQRHRSSYEPMRYQADKENDTEAFEHIMDDAVKAELALEDFQKENVGRWRKKFVVWAQWKRRYGVVVSFKERERGAADGRR